MGKKEDFYKKNKYEDSYIKLPIKILKTEEGGYIVSLSDKESEIFQSTPIGFGKTRQIAINKFWSCVEVTNKFNHSEALKLRRYEWFRKGPGGTGGRWFRILGIHTSFRKYRKDWDYSKNPMKGGFKIPFFPWNIRIINFWRKKYRKQEKLL